MKITKNHQIIREQLKCRARGCFNLLKDIFSEKEIIENTPKCLLYLIMGEFDLVQEDINVRSFYQWRLRYIAKLKKMNKNTDTLELKQNSERDWSLDGFVPTKYEDLITEEKPLIKAMW